MELRVHIYVPYIEHDLKKTVILKYLQRQTLTSDDVLVTKKKQIRLMARLKWNNEVRYLHRLPPVYSPEKWR